MTKTEQATSMMERMANDNSFGYLYGGWGPKDYDCGHAIITCWEAVGVPLKSKGASYTGNIREVALRCGFKDVTGNVNMASGNGLMRGDILLNTVNHVAMYCGSGKLVHARSSEGNSISGDQSGNEFRIQNYFNYPWNHVLRYQEDQNTASEQQKTATESPVTDVQPKTVSKCMVEHDVLEKGCVGIQVVLMQKALIKKGYSVGIDKDDGDFGPNTEAGLLLFQADNALEQDAKCGQKTWTKLLKDE